LPSDFNAMIQAGARNHIDVINRCVGCFRLLLTQLTTLHFLDEIDQGA
jgi:hypothetical protein